VRGVEIVANVVGDDVVVEEGDTGGSETDVKGIVVGAVALVTAS
jgi:hypothetical protein